MVTDWDRVIALADRELATAQLARVLHGVATGVPANVLDETRRKALALELRMQYLARRLQQTCAILAERRIPFILLKGTAVGALIDPTFCWRPMNDADILVRQQDARSASEALEAAGWTSTEDKVLRELLAGAHHHLPPFLDPQMPGIRVELHVSHLPSNHPFTFDAEMLWRDARPAPEPFAGALLPSPDHLLLHAAIHFAWQHPMSFGAWRTFRVVAFVANLSDFSWDRFVSAARAAKASSAVYWTLHLAARLSGIDVPREVFQRLTPPTPSWLRDALERHFVATIAVGELPTSPSVRLDHLLWLAAIRPRWSGHSTSRNWHNDDRWIQAYGTGSHESRWERVRRHVAEYHRWTSFMTATFFGRRSRRAERAGATTRLAPPA